jgi:hypothetical protein
VVTVKAANTKVAAIRPDSVQVRHGFRLFVHSVRRFVIRARITPAPPIIDDLAA